MPISYNINMLKNDAKKFYSELQFSRHCSIIDVETLNLILKIIIK